MYELFDQNGTDYNVVVTSTDLGKDTGPTLAYHIVDACTIETMFRHTPMPIEHDTGFINVESWPEAAQVLLFDVNTWFVLIAYSWRKEPLCLTEYNPRAVRKG